MYPVTNASNFGANSSTTSNEGAACGRTMRPEDVIAVDENSASEFQIVITG
jgi:hypothetical protein